VDLWKTVPCPSDLGSQRTQRAHFHPAGEVKSEAGDGENPKGSENQGSAQLESLQEPTLSLPSLSFLIHTVGCCKALRTGLSLGSCTHPEGLGQLQLLPPH
jgi:hypothetical protein